MKANVILAADSGDRKAGDVLGAIILAKGVTLADVDKAIARHEIRLVALEPPAPEDVKPPEDEPPAPEDVKPPEDEPPKKKHR